VLVWSAIHFTFSCGFLVWMTAHFDRLIDRFPDIYPPARRAAPPRR
jgi:hypothetical protein